MAKSKKQKTRHLNNSSTELSQAEIWDDSALIRSWEEARKEYDYYHSLAARGIDPDSLLDEAEEAEANGEPIPLGLEETAGSGGEVEDGEVQEGESDQDETAEAVHPSMERAVKGRAFIGPEPSLPPTADGATLANAGAPVANPTTDGLLEPTSASQVDQTLENVKMAYYWAGYYSGLYDGQRQAQQQSGSEKTAS